MDELIRQLELYGYVLIILSQFFGIVGVPAPEEPMMFLVGILAGYDRLELFFALVCMMLGVYIGMMVAYGLGRRGGGPVLLLCCLRYGSLDDTIYTRRLLFGGGLPY